MLALGPSLPFFSWYFATLLLCSFSFCDSYQHYNVHAEHPVVFSISSTLLIDDNLLFILVCTLVHDVYAVKQSY